MDVKEAWNVLTGWMSDLESLAETVENDDGESELDYRLEQNGGNDRINEAMKTVYDALGLEK